MTRHSAWRCEVISVDPVKPMNAIRWPYSFNKLVVVQDQTRGLKNYLAMIVQII